MYKGKKIFAVIQARAGSKGISGKNKKLLCGKPLIEYTFDSAKKSRYLDLCIVSSDDNEIIELANKSGVEAPFVRPSELATDTALGIDVAIHALKWAILNRGDFDYCMILQATSPLRTFEDIDESIKIAVESCADSVMSMVEISDFSVKKLKIIDENNNILPLFENEGEYSARRQDAKKVYKRNCAIYLTKKDVLLRGDMFGKNQKAYLMPFVRSVDINELIDFELAKFFLKRESKC